MAEILQVNQTRDQESLVWQLNQVLRRISVKLEAKATAAATKPLTEAQVRAIARDEIGRVDIGDLSNYFYLPGDAGGQTGYGGADSGSNLTLGANVAGDWSGKINLLSPIRFAEFDENPNTTTGLTWGYKSGVVRQGEVVTTVSAGTVVLPASSTNYIELDGSTGTVSTNTTGFSPDRIPLRQVITDATSQTSSVDKRTWIAERSPVRGAFVWTVQGNLVVATNASHQLRCTVPGACVIEKAIADVKTAPTGGSILIDINIGGTSIWNVTQANRLTIAASATTGSQTVFDTTAVANEALLTMDVDQVGATIAGADLTVNLRVKQRR